MMFQRFHVLVRQSGQVLLRKSFDARGCKRSVLMNKMTMGTHLGFGFAGIPLQLIA